MSNDQKKQKKIWVELFWGVFGSKMFYFKFSFVTRLIFIGIELLASVVQWRSRRLLHYNGAAFDSQLRQKVFAQKIFFDFLKLFKGYIDVFLFDYKNIIFVGACPLPLHFFYKNCSLLF